jgi:carbonic anhydrase/acetyltransferase-like protein (isoleucine patch superfamily)
LSGAGLSGAERRKMMKKPVIDPTVYVADGARILGSVEIGAHAGVWYNAVIRGDLCPIAIGENTNIQDLVVIHGDPDYPVEIGKNVSIGHSAVLHGCKVGDGSMVGMGSVVLNGAEIGKNCLIGAGSLVTKGTKIPDNSLAFGRPAKVIRVMTEEDLAYLEENGKIYRRLAEEARLSSPLP